MVAPGQRPNSKAMAIEASNTHRVLPSTDHENSDHWEEPAIKFLGEHFNAVKLKPYLRF
jgi:hypothetical protein